MTTFDAAAAWQKKKPMARALCVCLMALTLAGCETASSLFGSSSSSPEPSVANTAPIPPANSAAQVALAPVIGPPQNVSSQLQSQLGADMASQNIHVANSPTDKAEYTLRGYVVSSLDKKTNKVKISYIWDVTDASGKGVHRVSGEESVAAAKSQDPWTAVTPAVVQSISSKTVASLKSWLPAQSSPAVAHNAMPAPAAGVPPPAAPPTQTASITGSIAKPGVISARVPSVAGAPGDGSSSLSGALRRELARNGVTLTDGASRTTYTVTGKVALGAAKDGMQPISIDWNVTDPDGKKLGTVSQKNSVPQGSLDGAWGKTADAAAAAAAQGIVKLLPKSTQTSSTN